MRKDLESMQPQQRAAGVRIAALTLIVAPLLAGQAPARAADPVGFADPAFQRVWQRTDAPVAAEKANRSWYWGPAPGATVLEPMREAPGGQRRVQYFDKTRMEINDPAGDQTSPWYVTNGLLAVELMTGRMQVGVNSFEQRCPATIPLASDTTDANAPTYATFGTLMAQPKRDLTGQKALAVTAKTGAVGSDPARAAVPGITFVHYEPLTGRNIPAVFWDFLNTTGPIVVNGQYQTGKVNDPWFFASGLPVTDPYWARALINGQPTDVLIQAYERRVLTYIPSYKAPFDVQMGNVGQHYYDWRYKDAGCAPVLPRYAVDAGDFDKVEAVAAIKAAGIQMVRLPVWWAAVEAQPSDPSGYKWSYYDTVMRWYSRAGIQVMLTISACPAWACTYDGGPVDKVAPTRLATFWKALAERYSRPPFNVHFWELFNEPDGTAGTDHARGFGLHAADYVALLRAGVPAVRSVDPQAQFVLGGLGYEWFIDETPPGPFNRNFLRDFAQAGGGDYIDYVNFHYYPQNPHWPSVADKTATLRQVLTTLGLPQPLINTEIGLTSSNDPRWQPPGWPLGSEAVQARFLTRAYTEGLGAGLGSIAWFTLHDWNPPSAGLQIFAQAGLMRQDWSPKPAVQAYRTLMAQIGDRPALRRLDAATLGSAALDGYAFGTPGDQVWVVWSRTDATVPARLPVAGTIRALDLYGATLSLSGGRLAVGPDPVYLQVSGAR
jgi:aryl-phospho-beta-D-glucosidase BglC (GH1 family)